jgi:hypothetical protein
VTARGCIHVNPILSSYKHSRESTHKSQRALRMKIRSQVREDERTQVVPKHHEREGIE